jgi:hypothetical protein
VADADDVAELWRALGRQLAGSRRSAGLSQERLAGLAHCSRGTVANAETGRQRAPRAFWSCCDELLRTGGALSQAHGDLLRAEHADEVSVARYDSLTIGLETQLVFAGDGAQPAGGLWGQDDHPAHHGGQGPHGTGTPDDPQVLSFLEGALPGHAGTAAMFGGGDLLPLMVKQLKFLWSGRSSAKGKHREQLLGVCARYGEFLGWLCQDLGLADDARFWSAQGLRWAEETSNTPFVSYLLMRQSDLAEDFGTARQVLGLAQAAVEVAGLPPRAMALAAQQEALGYAKNGNELLFGRKLDEAREWVAADAASNGAPWGVYCTPVYIAMQEATGWLDLGQPGRAATVFERELVGLPPGDRVDAGVFRARLARAYAQDQQFDRAAQVALGAWDIAQDTGSRRAQAELTHVRQLISGQPQIPAVARLIAVSDTQTMRKRQRPPR